MAVNGIALAALAGGSVFLYAAIENKSALQTIRGIIQGKQPSVSSGGLPNSAMLNPSAGIPGVTQGIPVGVTATGTPNANKALGLLMAATYGWAGPGEWPYLESGWQEESGWSQYAANVPSDPYNHAYGIPQANPGSKMASAGSDWKTSPATQIKWGLAYIKSSYGAPSRVPGWSANGPQAGYVGY